ncbi:hypothetical protein [Pseudomonas sp. NPDC089406]|uniref:hypothetical protein n=1 Tax=Pseudomonas sp. NPDC089406 TaxID=3364463 RepID=UPI00384F13C0
MSRTSLTHSNTEIAPHNVGGIHSQASNFLSAVQSAVDPRTGQFNLLISIPLGSANDLAGPSLPFTLAFSSLGSHQNRGFGLGWSLLVTELSLAQGAQSLRLSSGEQFAIELVAGNNVRLLDHKLQALQVVRSNDGNYQVVHKDGQREVLKRVNASGPYVLHELRSAEGRRLQLEWRSANGINHLHEVRDDSGRVLARLDRSASFPRLLLEPGSAQESVITFQQSNNRLTGLLLPDTLKPCTFAYQQVSVGGGATLLFPNEVTNPLGGRELITWSSTAADSHRLPSGAPISFLPRVLRWDHQDGAADTTLSRRYTWAGAYNYLGFGSQQGFRWESGRDNLYKLLERYEYSVTETISDRQGNVDITVRRAWDRYHLQVLESTRTGNCETEVKTTYHVDYAKTWEAQHPFCQLPQNVQTTYIEWSGNTIKRQRSESSSHTFDAFGNPLTTVQVDGVEEVNEYYPAAGEPGKAPAIESGVVSLLKSRTVKPAGLAQGNHRGAPVLTTRYEYQNLPSLIAGDPPHAVVNFEELKDERGVLETTSQRYLSSPREHYGRLELATTTLAGTPAKPITTRYRYQTLQFQGQRALQTTTIIEGHPTDTVQHSQSSEVRSLVTGLTLRQTSAAGAHTDFYHDKLGRIVRTVLAVGTAYQTQRSCDYHLSDDFVERHGPRAVTADGSPSLLWRTGLEEQDATGQRKRSWLDGSGRVVLVQLEDLDYEEATPATAESVFREVQSTTYDAMGREIAGSATDWADDGKKLFTITSTTAYGPWGNAQAITAADGVITHALHDPIGRSAEQYQAVKGKAGSLQKVLSNAAGSPIQTELFDDGDGNPNKRRLVRTTHLVRDGLDRVVEQRVVPASGPQIVTYTAYDSYSRVIERTEPGELEARKVTWEYASHSDGDHPETVTVHTTENPA